MTQEAQRLAQAREEGTPWKKWGPYLSERQWGTVREDYSEGGDAWAYFSHDQARSRAYKWGEDGLAGLSDDRQRLCWALALWNGQDPILKERLFGLTNSEGNHGEDVKEYYFYLDSTPTHSYMKYLYKYPQGPYPYDDLVRTNRQRSKSASEYELLDTRIFDEDRYYDVFVEVAKAAPEDLLIRITVANRGPEPGRLQVLPHLWFRDTWWLDPQAARPSLGESAGPAGARVVRAEDPRLGTYHLYCEGAGELLFTDNETNRERLWGEANPTPYVKDAINDYVVRGQRERVNPDRTGTKAAALYDLTVGPGATRQVRLRLTTAPPAPDYRPFGDAYDGVFTARMAEADEFYASITPDSLDADQANVMRQAMAGMLWSKQFYCYDLDRWLDEHRAHPFRGGKRETRNRDWYHMVSSDIISMPDKWEYPWFAAWDLAFHTLALNLVDPDFAKAQLQLMLSDLYLHPNGQIPAYEWNFSDVNPPVHAWASLFSYSSAARHGEADLAFLKQIFHMLLMNFNWWVNRKDPQGNNLFSGGFLGLDNIGVFDRSAPLPSGGHLEQSDGTAWMAFFCQTMLQMATEISKTDPTYENFILKFTEHFLWIAGSMDLVGDQKDEMWDEEDGFFYDVLLLPDGRAERLKVRSMVGLLPLAASTVYPGEIVERFPRVTERLRAFGARQPELMANIHPINRPGVKGRRLLTVVNEAKLRRILGYMLDEGEFLSPYGIRSLPRWHLDHPYVLSLGGQEYHVRYLPAESDSDMFGGNSNWRGPIWMPVNVILIRALLQLYLYFGDTFKVECPTRSGNQMTLFEVARELSGRLARIFLRDADGRRAVFGAEAKFQGDPHWRDHLLFYEYFHGDNGAGLGASHQTGWTGVVSELIALFGRLDPLELLEKGLV
jgi:hypothetical protein